MVRVRCSALILLAFGIAAMPASADPITLDPIVRVRYAGGSVPIYALPFSFDFGALPNDPDGAGTDCLVFSEAAGTGVGCMFANYTGEPITYLRVAYTNPQPGSLVFAVEDPDSIFSSEMIDPHAATFSGGGIPDGRHFIIDLVGFPVGTTATLSTVPTSVPEPSSSLLLFAVGLAGVRTVRRWLQ